MSRPEQRWDDDLSLTSVGLRQNRRLSADTRIQEATKLVLEDLMQDSPFFDRNPARLLPTFGPTELIAGAELGWGEFGVVVEVAAIKLTAEADNTNSPEAQPGVRDKLPRRLDGICKLSDASATTENTAPPSECLVGHFDSLLSFSDHLEDDVDIFIDDENEKNERIDIMRKCYSQKAMREGEARFAIKRVRPDIGEKNELDAYLDLACEAQYLQSISHSNVIRLRGVSGAPGTPAFGLVLDRMVSTLDKQMKEWGEAFKSRHGGANRILKVFRPKRMKELDADLDEDRLLAVLDISRAMKHLHHKKILYRDLKPENIGYNVRGDVQIFDFGLAKELHSKDLVEDTDGYEATGLTGSRRFMAPEVVRCLPYGFSADVYSFSILLWSIFSLETPFRAYDANKHFEKVVVRKQRPHRLSKLHPALHRMMEEAWSDDRRKRPTFKYICELLQDVNKGCPMNRTAHLFDRSMMSLWLTQEQDLKAKRLSGASASSAKA